jgi:hypothetical protein
MNFSKLSTLSIEQLKALKDAVQDQLYTKTLETERQVKVTKIKDGTVRFDFKGKTYEGQKQGVRRRYRVYKMEKGLKPGTLKRGPVVSKEFIGTSLDLRSAIAFGQIK